jgi:hypothetical protein
VTLTWADRSSNESGFTVQRATNSGFTAGLMTFSVGANVTTYTDVNVPASTRFYYRVFAFNLVGNSGYSNARNLTTPGLLPVAPSTLAVGTVTRNSVVLTWTDNATNETGFRIQRATNAAFTTGVSSTTVNTPNLTTRTMTGLTSNRTYYYQVEAHNATGYSAWSNVVTFTTLP